MPVKAFLLGHKVEIGTLLGQDNETIVNRSEKRKEKQMEKRTDMRAEALDTLIDIERIKSFLILQSERH